MVETRSCRNCGQQFECEAGRRGRPPSFCSSTCRLSIKRASSQGGEARKKISASRRRRYRRRPPVSKVCRNCGKPFSFQPGDKGKRTVSCSDACRVALIGKAARESSKKARAEGRYAERERANKRQVIGERPCIVCGTMFLLRKANPDTEACGLSCGATLATRRAMEAGNHRGFDRIWFDKQSQIHHQNVSRRQRLRSGTPPGERVVASEIFARDRWICGLCHKKVDKRLKWPHKMSASLDHITPLIEGGAHAAHNLQCAHLLCNWLKQDGPGGQLRLFG